MNAASGNQRALSAKAWEEAFILELRLREITGDGIGDALSVVRSHCAESGETPSEAFGSPQEYARALEFAPHRQKPTGAASWARVLFPIFAGVESVTLVPDAVWALAREQLVSVTLGAVVSTVLFLAMLVLFARFADRLLRSMGLLIAAVVIFMPASMGATLFLRQELVQISPWVTLGTGLALLAAAVLFGRTALSPDPISSPLTGEDLTEEGRQPHRATSAAIKAGPWIFVVIVAYMSALSWFLGR